MFFIHQDSKPKKPKCVELDFEYMYKKYHNTVLVMACKLLLDKSLKDDVIQEVFMVFNEYKDSFPDEETAVKWLKVVTKNTIIDFYRKDSVYRERNILTADEEYYYDTYKSSDINLTEEYVLKRETAFELRPFIRDLPPKQRAIIDCYYYLDYTPLEIAKRFKISPYTVYSHLRKARETLKEQITEFYTKGGSD